ncbi:MAG: hypothetical protein JWP15_852 [Alphaproteobacteria bacterium]|nr:hypothetical protein [Alphaproteobacteria bacterium]
MDLLRRIERHLRRSGTAATRFGRDAVNDPRFVFDLRRGREPRPKVQARISAFLDECESRVGGRRRGA